MIIRYCVGVLLVAHCSVSILNADWPEFRGPSRNGAISVNRVPIVWSRETNVLWRAELPGEGWSSPAVVGANIYVTAAVKDDDTQGYELALLILNAKTGELNKKVTLFTETPDAPGIHNKNSHASPTPVIRDSRVYLHFGHQGTACTSLGGELIWKNDTLSYTPVHGNGGSPTVVGNHLIFSRDGADISKVTALDIETGDVAWETERNVTASKRFSFCTPLFIKAGGREQVIVPGSNVVQSLDPENGDEIWRVTYDGFSVVPRPIYESGLVFVCTGFMRSSVLAIDPLGSGDVTDTHVKWQSSASIPKTPSLVAFNGKLAGVSDNGVASCLDAITGEVLWKERVGGNFSASPIVAGKHLYLLDEKGVCTVLNVADGTKMSENKLDERSLASPAVIESDLLIRTSAALYRIGRIGF